MNTLTTPNPIPAAAATVTLPKRAVVAGGALGLLAVGALAGALVMQRSPGATPASEPAAVAAAAQATTTQPPAAQALAARPTASGEPVRSASRHGATGAGSTPTPLDTEPTAMAAVCASCGVVEAVDTVRQKGQGTGLGAVAGGVLGGVVGSQMGKGNGRSAMTVLGAVGGGLAGHEIEKRQRSTTSYRVKVRMDDGTLRTLSRAEPLAVGARVTVEGQSLHLRRDAAAQAPQPRLQQTANRGLQS